MPRPGANLVENAPPGYLVHWTVVFIGSRLASMAHRERAERRACLEEHRARERRWREDH